VPLVKLALSEQLATELDRPLLDTNPATAARPAGLRNNIDGLAPTAGGGETGLSTDLAALVAAIAPVAGSQIVFVASPDVYAKLALRPASPLAFPVFASGGLDAKTIMAVAVNSLAVGFGDQPSFLISRDTTLHTEDAAPTDISTPGAPATIAAPVVSMFQTDSIALRLILNISWVLRAPDSVSWASPVTW
jgi:hypothetical protein